MEKQLDHTTYPNGEIKDYSFKNEIRHALKENQELADMITEPVFTKRSVWDAGKIVLWLSAFGYALYYGLTHYKPL